MDQLSGSKSVALVIAATITSTIALSAPETAAERPAAPAQTFPLRLGTPREIASALRLYRPMGLHVGPDGSLYIADLGESQITKLSVDGEVRWRAGREGEGPGEFRTLYRLAVGADGGVAAFDVRTQNISWFDADGRFLRRAKLGLSMRQVVGMVLLPGGRLAISGYARSAPEHGVHLFDAELTHVSSFGRLPPAENPRALYDWGAGSLDLAETGELLYLPWIPYQIYRFSAAGEPRGMIERDYTFSEGPDDLLVETPTGDGRILYSTSSRFVPQPWGTRDLGGGYLLAGVIITNDDWTWDLFHDGELVASVDRPEDWIAVDVDRRRHFLYVKSSDAEGDPIYLQVPYSIAEQR